MGTMTTVLSLIALCIVWFFAGGWLLWVGARVLARRTSTSFWHASVVNVLATSSTVAVLFCAVFLTGNWTGDRLRLALAIRLFGLVGGFACACFVISRLLNLTMRNALLAWLPSLLQYALPFAFWVVMPVGGSLSLSSPQEARSLPGVTLTEKSVNRAVQAPQSAESRQMPSPRTTMTPMTSPPPQNPAGNIPAAQVEPRTRTASSAKEPRAQIAGMTTFQEDGIPITEYFIVHPDTFVQERVRNDTPRWTQIVKANPSVDFHKLRPGQFIQLPAAQPTTPPQR